ncbi:MAG: prepilin-type N-terminal cleavage/methylation domain-containing protein [Planctomycetaceae bacterium]|nr:prepilin-type N-terminal cleavage/methylation domain-containing protein [Planctomycetaceae bacterium]
MVRRTSFRPFAASALRDRRGFTLVELLVVIAIIGMLMAITVPAVWKFVQSAKEAKIMVEIDQLQTALQSYKEKRVGYPPSLAEANLSQRRIRFMKHVLVAFTNANYGTAEGNFNNLRNGLMSTTANSFTVQQYNYKTPGGNLQGLDLNTLDQAESLVFWLGGFPTPYNTNNQAAVSNRRLFGFHRDQDAPFKRDNLAQEGADPMRYRTDLFYQFDETRLVDQDGDGWYEYLPIASNANSTMAPFVYFDAESYSVSSSPTGSALNISLVGYPRDGDPGAADLAAKIGLAVPMAEYIDPTNANPMRWQKPESFQIICGGLDGMFSAPLTTELNRAMKVPVYPAGQVYEKQNNYSQQTALTAEDNDNLNNLGNVTVATAAQNAGK